MLSALCPLLLKHHRHRKQNRTNQKNVREQVNQRMIHLEENELFDRTTQPEQGHTAKEEMA